MEKAALDVFFLALELQAMLEPKKVVGFSTMLVVVPPPTLMLGTHVATIPIVE